jgi:hypothetical protein
MWNRCGSVVAVFVVFICCLLGLVVYKNMLCMRILDVRMYMCKEIEVADGVHVQCACMHNLVIEQMPYISVCDVVINI